MGRLILSVLLFLASVAEASDNVIVIEAESGKLVKEIKVENGAITSDKKNGGHAEFDLDLAGQSNSEIKIIVRATHPEEGKIFRVDVKTNSGNKKIKAKSTGQMVDLDGKKEVVVLRHKKDHLNIRLSAVEPGVLIDSFKIIVPDSMAMPTSGDDSSSESDDQAVVVVDEDAESIEAPERPDVDTSRFENRASLLEELEGFGQGTTGGLDGELCRVSSLENSGPGSLRSCATGSKAKWIVFDVSGTIELDDAIKIPSNMTIDGAGQDVVIKGMGLYVTKANNVILHNLTIRDIKKDDAIKIYQSTNVWVHHVTLENGADGLIDITGASTNVTVSYCKLSNHNKTMLIGANNSHVDDKNTKVTIHHNYFYKTIRRNPLIRYAKVHMYNNFIRAWGSGNTGDAVNATYYSQLRLENNIFEPVNERPALRTTIPNWVEVPGYVHASGNLVIGGDSLASENADRVFSPAALYEYKLNYATSELRDSLINHTGANARSESPFIDLVAIDEPLEAPTQEAPSRDIASTQDSCEAPCEADLQDLSDSQRIGFLKSGDGFYSDESNRDPLDETRVIRMKVLASEAGQYRVKLLCEGPSSSENSIFVKVNEDTTNAYHFNRFGEAEIKSKRYDFVEGENTIELIPRESGLVCFSVRVE